MEKKRRKRNTSRYTLGSLPILILCDSVLCCSMSPLEKQARGDRVDGMLALVWKENFKVVTQALS